MLKGSNKKDYQKEYMRLRRSNTGLTKEGSNGVGLTEYPAIVRAITDPIKRKKLERISQELNSRGLGKDVRYGIGGPTFDIVAKLLEVTR